MNIVVFNKISLAVSTLFLDEGIALGTKRIPSWEG